MSDPTIRTLHALRELVQRATIQATPAMTTDARRHALLELIAAQLEQERAHQCLKKAQIGRGKVASNTVFRIFRGENYRMSSLVEVAEDMGLELVVTFKRKAS